MPVSSLAGTPGFFVGEGEAAPVADGGIDTVGTGV